MLSIFAGVIMIITGSLIGVWLGPQPRGIFQDPSWNRRAREFVAIVVSWVLILTGVVVLLIGLIDFGNWVLTWL